MPVTLGVHLNLEGAHKRNTQCLKSLTYTQAFSAAKRRANRKKISCDLTKEKLRDSQTCLL